jgi:hypothetical protein
MRGRGTALLIAAVVALGVIATVDALRGAGSDPEAEPDRPVVTQSPAADLRRADVSGVLYLSTRSEDGCRLRALSLPALQDFASFRSEWCRFDVSPQGHLAAGPPCPEGPRRPVEVWPVDAVSSTWRGCAPAWRPRGELTFVRDGDVVTLDGDVLVEEVARFARSSFPEGSRISVREMGWLSDDRLALVLRGTGVHPDLRDVVVVIEDDRRLSRGQFHASRIQVSQEAQQIFVAYHGAGFVVYNPRGAVVSEESRFPFADVAATTDSPDTRWLALARPGNVCIYEPVEPPPREEFPIACLPFDAVDLAWR